MTQEQKDLLLKNLCSRLPYGVKIKIKYYGDSWKMLAIYTNSITYTTRNIEYSIKTYFKDRKPYLFPLSSITDKMWNKEFMECEITEFIRDSFKYDCETLEFNNSNPNLSNTVRFIDQLIKNHFDVYDLIPMGLANDASGLNIY